MSYEIVYSKTFKTEKQAKNELHKLFAYSERDLFDIIEVEE